MKYTYNNLAKHNISENINSMDARNATWIIIDDQGVIK